jgi:hypothetical protein
MISLESVIDCPAMDVGGKWPGSEFGRSRPRNNDALCPGVTSTDQDQSVVDQVRGRSFNWLFGFAAGVGLGALFILVVKSIETILMTLIGAIAIGLGAFVYRTEVTRQEEEADQAQKNTTLANYRAGAVEALETELKTPEKKEPFGPICFNSLILAPSRSFSPSA